MSEPLQHQAIVRDLQERLDEALKERDDARKVVEIADWVVPSLNRTIVELEGELSEANGRAAHHQNSRRHALGQKDAALAVLRRVRDEVTPNVVVTQGASGRAAQHVLHRLVPDALTVPLAALAALPQDKEGEATLKRCDLCHSREPHDAHIVGGIEGGIYPSFAAPVDKEGEA